MFGDDKDLLIVSLVAAITPLILHDISLAIGGELVFNQLVFYRHILTVMVGIAVGAAFRYFRKSNGDDEPDD